MGDNVWELRETLMQKSTNDEPTEGAPTESVVINDLRLTTSHKNNTHAEKTPDSNSVHVIMLEEETKPKDLDCNTFKPVRLIDGSVISFKGVNYGVKVRGKSLKSCCGAKETQFVVKDVSGLFGPGINAILGPTGSGKSSLLDILAGRKNSEGLSGEVLVNGFKQPTNYKCMIGYVIQDDMVMGMLTVRENVEFSAALRLPSGTTEQRRKEKVDEIISDLGLSKCANTKIGTEFQRGVSGGERKRTSVAMELVTSPSVLFLDEPTTGLDAYTAHSVMLLLKRLSRRGMTVIMSIHQPRYSIFKLFDTLMLMSHGQCIFFGPAKDGLEHFQTGNYFCEDHDNPSDFFLDVLSGCIPPVIPLSNNCLHDDNHVNADNGQLVSKELEADGFLQTSEGKDCSQEIVESLVDLYRSSKWHQKMDLELTTIHEKSNAAAGETVAAAADVLRLSKVSYPTSVAKQFAVVSSRTWHNMIRNRHALLTQMCSALILGLIVGSIYFRVGISCASGIDNRIGAFFFIVMNYVFGNMSAVDIFIKERAIFIHETVSGYYRVSSYFFAKLFCDIMPQRVFPIVLFAVITYFMIGFQMAAEKFMFYLLNIILTSLSGAAVALLFSASTRQHTIGTILTALVWVSMMIFSGRMVNVETIPRWLQWLKWFSIFRYSMNAFMVNELKDLGNCTLSSNATLHKCTTGDDCLTMYGIPHESVWDLWSNELALLVLAFAFLLLTYVQLRRSTALK